MVYVNICITINHTDSHTHSCMNMDVHDAFLLDTLKYVSFLFVSLASIWLNQRATPNEAERTGRVVEIFALISYSVANLRFC